MPKDKELVQISARISKETMDRIREMAKEERRSQSNMVDVLLGEAVERYGKKTKRAET